LDGNNLASKNDCCWCLVMSIYGQQTQSVYCSLVKI
jgi:hypothetical protein